MEHEAPVFILMAAALGWAMMNVLFLGFTAFEIVAMKSFALSLAGVGVVWLTVNLWEHLHRPKE